MELLTTKASWQTELRLELELLVAEHGLEAVIEAVRRWAAEAEGRGGKPHGP